MESPHSPLLTSSPKSWNMTRNLFPWWSDNDTDTHSHRPWSQVSATTAKPSTGPFFYPPATASQQLSTFDRTPPPNTITRSFGHTPASSTAYSAAVEREKLGLGSEHLPPTRHEPSMSSPGLPLSSTAPNVLRKPTPTLRIVLFLVADAFLALCLGSTLSLVYLLLGHSILRSTHPFPDPYTTTPLLSSINAGALGGLIIALPLGLVIILLLPAKEIAPDDFFEDDDDGICACLCGSQVTWRTVGIIVCGMLALAYGALAGPIGVLCLGGGREDSGFLVEPRMLSPAHAAQAGAVGGAVGGPAVAIAVVLVLLMWRTMRLGTKAYTG